MTHLPAHFFINVAGDLYDIRKPGWSDAAPLRPAYSCHSPGPHDLTRIKATLRAGEYAWPGGYRLAFASVEGDILSFDAVRSNFREVVTSHLRNIDDGWRLAHLIMCEVYADGEDKVFCSHTGEVLYDPEE